MPERVFLFLSCLVGLLLVFLLIKIVSLFSLPPFVFSLVSLTSRLSFIITHLQPLVGDKNGEAAFLFALKWSPDRSGEWFLPCFVAWCMSRDIYFLDHDKYDWSFAETESSRCPVEVGAVEDSSQTTRWMVEATRSSPQLGKRVKRRMSAGNEPMRTKMNWVKRRTQPGREKSPLTDASVGCSAHSPAAVALRSAQNQSNYINSKRLLTQDGMC